MSSILIGAIVAASLSAGILLSYRLIPIIFRGAPILRFGYFIARVVGGATEAPYVRAIFAVAGVSAVVAVELLVSGTGSAIAGLSIFGFYQMSRRVVREWHWREVSARAGYAYTMQDEDALEHEYLKVTYVVKSSGKDEWARTSVIKARHRVIIFKGIVVGAAGQNTGILGDYRRLCLYAWAEKGRVIPLPVSEDLTGNAQQQEISLVFTKPVEEGQSRQFYVAGVWPNMWQPLRDSGEDEGSLSLERPVKHLEIEVILPRGIKNARFERLAPNESDNLGSVMLLTDARGRLRYTWSVQDVQPQVLRYRVNCAELCELSTK